MTDKRMAHQHHATFESIRHFDEAGSEFWSARDLAPLLEYQDWRNFMQVVDKARVACAQSGHDPEDHFGDVSKMVAIGSGAQRSAYNNVKHHRHTHFAEANLEHALHAVAGLFVLLLYFYPEEAEQGWLSPDPTLFRASDQFYTDRLMCGDGSMVYKRIGVGRTGEQ